MLFCWYLTVLGGLLQPSCGDTLISQQILLQRSDDILYGQYMFLSPIFLRRSEDMIFDRSICIAIDLILWYIGVKHHVTDGYE